MSRSRDMAYAMSMVGREAAAGAGVGVLMPGGAGMSSDVARGILGGPSYDRDGAGGGAGAGAGGGGGGVAVGALVAEPRHRASPPGKGKGWKMTYEDVNKNFMVVIRVRPPLPRELHNDKPFQNVVSVDPTERQITISENLNEPEDDIAGPYSSHTFTFDHVYDPHCDQRKVYEMTAKGVVESSLQGYNATIFAYGQTGTGKTYTMEGFNSAEERGIIPRAIEQIFKHIQTSVSPRMRFLVRASYLQIYNEVISDLLKPERSNLVIREDKKKGVFVEGLSEWVVRSPQEIYGLMERGGAMRATGSTKMNELSSRSHAVFIIIAEQSETTYLDEHGNEMSVEDFHKLVKSRAHGEHGRKLLETNVRQSFKVGKLNLVDLAGSERVRLTGATGQRLEESKKINQSLSALGNVIAALTDPRGRQHIPYRDSKLTRILEDSLGGNCKTTMMAMISPALEAFVESLSTLKFANRAKNIKNEARVNEDLDQKSLLRRYERELKQLRAQLEERNRIVVDQRRLLELDEQRRRAEEDKMAAIRALEARSLEFQREKREKRALEERISALQGQMLIGGTSKVQESPAFRSAVKEHQERVRAEYEARLHDLEKERESIEEEKAQVDRYKQLLLKQRDIMILLTQRLNERDEQIVALQDELDAYDQHQRDLENKLDEKTTALIHLQRVTMEHNAASPVKNTDLVDALGPWGKLKEAGGVGAGGGAGAAAAPVPPNLLITTPQYRPFDAPTVFSGAEGGAGHRESQPTTLLSAEDKIAELSRIVEATKAEQQRTARELEEIQAEKVSMEYLLREKLEKLVQSQIEVRLASYSHSHTPADSAALKSDLEARTRELAAARAEHSRSEAELKHMRRRMSGGDMAGGGAAGAGTADDSRLRELAARLEEKNTLVTRLQEENARLRDASATSRLEDQVATHEKERRAIQTIMEQKIKSLVDAIASLTMAELGPSGSGARNVQRLLREVQALQRLVNASISALRNSATERQRASKAPTAAPSAAPPPLPPAAVAASPRSKPSSSAAAPPPSAASAATGATTARHQASVEAMIQARKEELQRHRQGLRS